MFIVDSSLVAGGRKGSTSSYAKARRATGERGRTNDMIKGQAKKRTPSFLD